MLFLRMIIDINLPTINGTYGETTTSFFIAGTFFIVFLRTCCAIIMWVIVFEGAATLAGLYTNRKLYIDVLMDVFIPENYELCVF